MSVGYLENVFELTPALQRMHNPHHHLFSSNLLKVLNWYKGKILSKFVSICRRYYAKTMSLCVRVFNWELFLNQ